MMEAHDVTEDDDQNKRLQDCVDLLIASGYFRARIKGLSAFDKVVGGMVWCISVCNYSVDVDLLYAENASIGQKIALTEKIVEILPSLKCPYSIEPHQIQGLDFINIFPVVQWLVKSAIEAKKLYGDEQEALSDYHTKQEFGCAVDQVLDRFDELNSSLVPERRFKRGPLTNPANNHDDALCTIAEYSENRFVSDPSVIAPVEMDTLEESIQRDRVSNKAIRVIIDNLASSTECVSPLTRQQELAVLIHQIEFAESETLRLSAELQDEQLKKEDVTSELAEKEHKKSEDHDLLSGFTDDELIEMRSLLAEYGQVSQREKQFKSSCRGELAAIQEEIDNLCQFKEDDVKTSLAERLITDLDGAENELGAERLLSSEVLRRVTTLQRQMDSVPSQIEMSQYQERFIELYNQMATMHRQTKQYFTLHNTLLDVRNYMKKEIDLLSKIEDVLPMATKDAFRDSFIQNLQEILRIVEANHDKLVSKSSELEERRSEQAIEYAKLKDTEREFHRATKKFELACKLNEELIKSNQQDARK